MIRRLIAALWAAAFAASAIAQNATPQNTVITSDHLEMWSTDTEANSIFTSNVVVTGTNVKITCDKLEVVAFRKTDPQGAIGKIESFKSLIATGNVRIQQGDREAACGKAIVLPGDDKLILQERPVLVDHVVNWTYTGDDLVLYRGERKVAGKNVRIVGPPLKDLGVDHDKLLGKDEKPTASDEPPSKP